MLLTRDMPLYMFGKIANGDIGDAVRDLHYSRYKDTDPSVDSGADLHCSLAVTLCATLIEDGLANEEGSDHHECAADVSSVKGTKFMAMSHYRDSL